ncbi:MAG: efflux RND transporter periplasmic adaptor subunit [Nitratireductor sp.]|nr:efflux RND transporter periplasmic adaptor subunit [Nitratireductor sp.]MCC0020461.1 efflux RND transporter periplasmic adaptor subunit [Nitratireductor sp.]
MNFLNRISQATALALVLAATPAGIAVAAGSEPAANSGEANQKNVQLPSIYVHTAAKQHFRVIVPGSGFVQPVEEVFVQPEVQGIAIDEVLVDIGDTVEQGEVLARLKQDQLLLEKSRLEATLARTEAGVAQLQAAVAEAEANAIAPRDNFKRAEALYKSKTISEAQYDQAKAAAEASAARVNSAKANLEASRLDVKVAQAQLGDIGLRLQRTDVKAPVAGLVSGKSAKIGALASGAGEPLFTIIRDGELELRVELAGSELVRIRAGMPVSVELAGSPEKIEADVRLVDPTINMQSRMGTVRISLKENDIVRAGMFAEANILIAEKDVIAIPLPSLSIENGQATVLKVSDGVVTKTNVDTGFQSDGMVEITSGLSAGEVIVAKAGAFVRDGDRINPVFETGAEASLDKKLN